MTRSATVLCAGRPAGAAFSSIVPAPGSLAPQLAEGRSGPQRTAGRCLKQMARGRLAGRRQDPGASTWHRRETADGVPTTAVRWLSPAGLTALPVIASCRAAGPGSWLPPW